MKNVEMASFVASLVLILPVATSAAGLHGSRDFLAGSLRPEVVAQTLVRVEDEWKAQAASYAECNAGTGGRSDCKGAQQSFGKSCSTVVNAIVQGSSGDQNKARTYMQTVCSQKSLQAWHKDRCFELKQVIDGALQFNEYANRMHFNSAKLCNSFWSTFADSELKRAVIERAAQKEMLKSANEKAQAIAKQRQEDEARERVAEAQRLALETKEKAAAARKEAAERLAHKRAEAEALAVAAQQKVKKAALEAAKATEEHRQRTLEHEKAEEHLRKIAAEHKKATGVNATVVIAPVKVAKTIPEPMPVSLKIGARKAYKEGIIVTPVKDQIVIAVSNITKVATKA